MEFFKPHVTRRQNESDTHSCKKDLERMQTFAFVAFDFQQSGGNVHESTKDLAQ